MKRDLLINILLILAGIALAVALFGAGAIWKGKTQPSRPTASAPKERIVVHTKISSVESMSYENFFATPGASAVVINGHVLLPQQLQELATNYAAAPAPGRRTF